MDINNAFESFESVLCEQIARHMFEIVDVDGPLVAILDHTGGFRPSDSSRFEELNLSEENLREMCVRIDDGEEPVITQMKECTVILAQLATERTNCGYIVIVLPNATPERAMTDIGLVELVVGQANLTARLVEKNALLYELRWKQYSPDSMYAESACLVN